MVSLPRPWVTSNGLRKGGTVNVSNSSDGGLLIYPSEPASGQDSSLTIGFPSEFGSASVSDEVLSGYLLGYNVVEISARKTLPPDVRRAVSDTVRRLVGFEIVEETASSITIQFLVDLSTVKPQKLLRRLNTLVNSMLRDTLNGLKSRIPGEATHLISERDSEVNRLYFLIVRLLRAAARSPRLASTLGIRVIDCLDYRVAAGAVENTGDCCAELASQKPKVDSAALRTLLNSVSENMVSIQKGSVDALVNGDYAESKRLLESARAVARQLHGFKSPDAEPADMHVVNLLERIVSYQVDVLDLVSPSPYDDRLSQAR